MPALTPEPILDFWFAGVTPDGTSRWFRRDPQLDAEIGARFGAAVEAALSGALDPWAAEPRSGLALLILLDQYTRNLFRGSARAFAGDAKARAVAAALVDRGDDRALSPLERIFVYLPFEHSEDPADQARSLACFEALAAEAGPPFEGFLDYARQHAEIIERFGRYPHRNAALGRESSPEEQAWLAAGGGF